MSRKSAKPPKKADASVRAKLAKFAKTSRLANLANKKGAGAAMTFLPENQEVVFDPQVGLSVLQVALLAGLPIGHSCGGNGTCTTCRVFVENDLADLPESARTRNELEAEMALERGFEPRERLSCQVLAFNGLKVRRPVDQDEAAD